LSSDQIVGVAQEGDVAAVSTDRGGLMVPKAGEAVRNGGPGDKGKGFRDPVIKINLEICPGEEAGRQIVKAHEDDESSVGTDHGRRGADAGRDQLIGTEDPVIEVDVLAGAMGVGIEVLQAVQSEEPPVGAHTVVPGPAGRRARSRPAGRPVIEKDAATVDLPLDQVGGPD